MMKKTLSISTIILTCSSLLLITTAPAFAATTPSATSTTSTTSGNYGQALEIAPPLIYLSVNPGQSVGSQVILRNISAGSLEVTGTVNDFVAAGEDGTPKILLNNDSTDPYSLKSWISPIASSILQPSQIKTLPFVVNVPANASPGGHYGVIRFTGTPPSLNGGSGVSLNASIGALLLITVSGKITHHLSVKQFNVNQNGKAGSFFQSGPLDFSEVLNNTGNVHEQPTGLVTVKDMFGSKLATLPVNTPPGNILPASSRKFDEQLNKSVIGNKRLFGHYTATLSLSYGSPKQTLTASLSYWVIPLKLIGIIIVVLIILVFGLRFILKRYKKRILRQANNQPRPPQRPQGPSAQPTRPTVPQPPNRPPRPPVPPRRIQ